MHKLALSGTGGIAGLVLGYVALLVLFGLLERRFPEKRQRRLRPGFGVDTLWFFVDGAVRFVAGIAVVVAVAFSALWLPRPGVPGLASQPRWLQLLEVLLVGDLLQYWVHRALHGRRLWRLHSVHHSIEQLDWLAAARVHPLETILARSATLIPLFLLGFSAVRILPLLAVVLAIYPIALHANVRWDFGPLRRVLASPAFHHWHHTAEAEGMNRNFAGMFPFIDLAFGTFYLPRRASESYGLGGGERMELSLTRQLAYPFLAGRQASRL